jgi:histidyl-tRNA synthetase
MANIIQPRVLKGFRDSLPASEIERRSLTTKIEESFRLFGFVPIDTPALEYAEILLGKGGGETEKQIYRFKDNGGRDVALRFDLTVPFARFCAEHYSELTFPFKRYHIAKVWRGENTQRGRYREFFQCDADIVGSDSAGSDFEILLTMQSVFKALGIDKVTLKLNHRGLFNRFLEKEGLAGASVEILRTVDKLAKVGRDATLKSLEEFAGEKAPAVLDYIEAGRRGAGYKATLEAITAFAGGPCPESRRMEELYGFMQDTGTEDSFVLDPSITRGLDYYTGLVFETFLDEMPDIGSVCSGGRYDNLAGLYTKEKLPGVGASVGLDRLIAALGEMGRSENEASGFVPLAVACLDGAACGKNQALAGRFRQAGIATTVINEARKPVQQYIQAEKQGQRWVITQKEEGLTLRDLKTRKDYAGLGFDDAVTMIKG